jgi:hypothetical protein
MNLSSQGMESVDEIGLFTLALVIIAACIWVWVRRL